MRDFQTFMGSRFPTHGGGDFDVEARIHDMDDEGTDVQFIVNSGGAGQKDPALEMEFVKAPASLPERFLRRVSAPAEVLPPRDATRHR